MSNELKKLMDNFDSFINEEDDKGCECGCGGSCGCDNDEDEVEEDYGYMTPNAFAKSDEDHMSYIKKIISMGKGYSELHPYSGRIYEILKDVDGSSELLNEISYTEYATDDSKTNKRKINDAVNKMNGKLFKVERMLDRNIKLKEAIGGGDDLFWEKTRKNIRKIAERLNRINLKIKKLAE